MKRMTFDNGLLPLDARAKQMMALAVGARTSRLNAINESNQLENLQLMYFAI
jgi:hypothetical protein